MSEAETQIDENWYLEKYPDVAVAISKGVVRSAQDHYVRHGIREGRAPFPPERPVVHVHIPKTAGTAIRGAFLRAKKKVFSAPPEFTFKQKEHTGYGVISGHFGFASAQTVPNAALITVLRDPVDRFLSTYYYLVEQFRTGKEISERTKLAANFSLDQFVEAFDCPDVVQELFNAVTWQIVSGSTFKERSKFRDAHRPTEHDLLQYAINNLKSFQLVGFQSSMQQFSEAFSHDFGFPIALEHENVTAKRDQADDLSTKTLRKIYDWVYLDIELYRWAASFYRTSS